MDGWGTIISAAASATAAMAAVLITQAFTGRRWRQEREERRWAEALGLARIVSSADESDLARAIAKHRLDALGITAEWLAEHRDAERTGLADRVFGHPVFKESEIATVESALAQPPAVDEDVGRMMNVWSRIDHMFGRPDDRLQEETPVRIFVIATLFAMVFALLALSATVEALS